MRASVRGLNATEACIALNMLPKMGPVRLRKLLAVFQSPERILTARPSELPIAPAHRLATLARSALRSAPYNDAPIGNGPFLFGPRRRGAR